MVLRRLQTEGLKARLEKCSFFQQEVKYLGHVISAQGVSTDPKKCEAVAKWKRPQNVSELRSLLGFASYYRRSVEGFAEMSGKKPKKGLNKALEAVWTTQCEQSFEGLKDWLVSAPV